MKIRSALPATALVLLCSSCTTVDSKRATDTLQPPGLVYYLPMRMLQVKVTASPIDLAALATSRDDARELMDAARLERAKTAEAEESARVALSKAKPKQLARLREAHATALDQARYASDEFNQLEQLHARATAHLADARLVDCNFTATIEALPAKADPAHRYVARLSHNGTRDDSLKLEVSAEGLLTSSDLTSVDRTGDILVELAGVLSPLPTPSLEGKSNMTDGIRESCAGERTFVFDPAAQLAVDDTPKSAQDLPAFAAINQQLSKYKISLDVEGLQGVPRNNDVAPRWGAIYYRAPMPVIVKLTQSSGLTTSTVVNIPQLGPTAHLPMKANSFVTTADKVTIVDGSVTSWTTNRPSEALAVVRLPLAIIKSAIMVPTEIFKLRIDYDSNAKVSRKNDLDRIQEDAKRKKLDACIAAAEETNTDVSECFKE